jgi:hypothetical protein
MNEIGEKYLPIGSVVILKNATKRIMITGFASMSPETGDAVYDYSGCMYPEGFFDYNQVCVFNHEDIAQLFSKGYVDDEQVAFEKKLVEERNKVSKKNNE